MEKLPADRFTDAQDFARALGDEHFRYGEEATAGAGAAAGPWNRLTIASAILAGVLVVTLLVLASPLFDRPAPEVVQPTPEVVRFSVPLGQDVDLYLGFTQFGRPTLTSLTLSPDGDLLVYAASFLGQNRRLYMRRWDQEAVTRIAGTEGGYAPFFSPDGAWIGFRHPDGLKRVSLVDGNIETITPSSAFSGLGTTRGLSWGDDGTIVVGVQNGRLLQVAATGGEPEVLVEWDSGDERLFYGAPHMLPGSEVLLFHARRSYDPETAEIVALDRATGTQKTVLTDAMDPRYVQTGHLLFMRRGTLMAVAFDLEGVEVQGRPVIMVEGVMHSIFMPNFDFETGLAQVAVSASGHLVYARGGVYPERPHTAPLPVTPCLLTWAHVSTVNSVCPPKATVLPLLPSVK